MREGGLLSTRERVRENGTHLKKCGMILITALFGFVILAAAGQFGRTAQAVINLPAMVLLAVAANVDMHRNVIPDWVTLPGLAWALLASAFLGGPRLSDAVLGMALCGGVLLTLAIISRGSIGGGDVKLMAMIGALLGWRWGFGVLAAAQISAALLALCLFIAGQKGRKDTLPFGPFLAAFALLALVGRPMQ